MSGRTLVVFAKPPLMGRTKTRLAAGIGPVRAAGFYRAATHRLLTRLDDPRWRTVLAVNAAPGERYACWPRSIPRVPQGQGSLGDRMTRVLAALPRGPALVIGTDSPQVEPGSIAAAFAALGSADAVFGPADDGGYWLIGLARRRPAPDLFSGVRWSTEHALADTRASLPETYRVGMLPVLTDVDTAGDLRALTARYGPLRRGPWGSSHGTTDHRVGIGVSPV